MTHLPIVTSMSDYWLRQALRSIEVEQSAASATSPATKAALELTQRRIEQLAYQPVVDMTDAVESLIEAAQIHGEDSEPDHEVGDLQDILRAIWKHLTPAQRAAALRSSEVSQVLEGAGHQPLATKVDDDVDDWDRVCEFYGLDTSFQYTDDAILDYTNMYRLATLQSDGEELIDQESTDQVDGPRYVHGVWEHIFAPGRAATVVRIVYDRHAQELLAMDVNSGPGRWHAATGAEMADVQDSLQNANSEALSDPNAWGLVASDEPPAWSSGEATQAVGRPRPQ